MTIQTLVDSSGVDVFSEKLDGILPLDDNQNDVNPVLEGAEFVLKRTDIVHLNEPGIVAAAQHIHKKLLSEAYSPRTWRTHPLHICPPEPYSHEDPRTRLCLNWVFLISSLNFSFWSEREGHSDRYGVYWRTGWDSEQRTVHTGYWSLVAAINRALEEGIPFTDPSFYADKSLCPDALIEHIFRPAQQCTEKIPLLKERIGVLREVGSILCSHFGGSFQGFLEESQRRYHNKGTALQLVKMITDTFPSFRDETFLEGRRACFWKRAQILVAEAWAAFYPASHKLAHPLFPNGSAIHQLTMFADYRVPQILHHLRIITYPPALLKLLLSHAALAPGCREEVSIRAASIVAVERVREEIVQIWHDDSEGSEDASVSSVIIDFYLWDLAKRIERGEEGIEGIETDDVVPAHRTRSIWY